MAGEGVEDYFRVVGVRGRRVQSLHGPLKPLYTADLWCNQQLKNCKLTVDKCKQ